MVPAHFPGCCRGWMVSGPVWQHLLGSPNAFIRFQALGMGRGSQRRDGKTLWGNLGAWYVVGARLRSGSGPDEGVDVEGSGGVYLVIVVSTGRRSPRGHGAGRCWFPDGEPFGPHHRSETETSLIWSSTLNKQVFLSPCFSDSMYWMTFPPMVCTVLLPGGQPGGWPASILLQMSSRAVRFHARWPLESLDTQAFEFWELCYQVSRDHLGVLVVVFSRYEFDLRTTGPARLGLRLIFP